MTGQGKPTTGRPELDRLVEEAKRRVEAMTPEELEAMWRAQRESWVRGEMGLDRKGERGATIPFAPIDVVDLEARIRELEAENARLRAIAGDLHWMARRYVDGRMTYAVGLFNGHVRDLLRLGVRLIATADGTIWARDGSGNREMDGLNDGEAAMGKPLPARAAPSQEGQ